MRKETAEGLAGRPAELDRPVDPPEPDLEPGAGLLLGDPVGDAERAAKLFRQALAVEPHMFRAELGLAEIGHREIEPRFHLAIGVFGQHFRQHRPRRRHGDRVPEQRATDRDLRLRHALAVLRGNLAPDGCVIKPSAMSEKFLVHSGKAVVFDFAESRAASSR